MWHCCLHSAEFMGCTLLISCIIDVFFRTISSLPLRLQNSSTARLRDCKWTSQKGIPASHHLLLLTVSITPVQLQCSWSGLQEHNLSLCAKEGFVWLCTLQFVTIQWHGVLIIYCVNFILQLHFVTISVIQQTYCVLLLYYITLK